MPLNLRKGAVAPVPGNAQSTKWMIGMGWTAQPPKPGVTKRGVDADAVLFGRDAQGNTREEWALYFNQLTIDWAKHSGDVRGEGSATELDASGDDERMYLDGAKIPDDVKSIDFYVFLNNFEDAKPGDPPDAAPVRVAADQVYTFGDLLKAHFRLVNETTGQEEVRVDLTKDDFFGDEGVLVVQMVRSGSGWELRAVAKGGPQFRDLGVAFDTANPAA